MNEHTNERYLLQQYELQQKQYIATARQHRLKAEVLAAARQQRQTRRLSWRIRPLGVLRSLYRLVQPQPQPQQPCLADRTKLETGLP
ncbi:MAG: hypothetical protein CL610_28280 [Anaerolineaceae bacterium]|nr:hypothetical protein [Anaerolineaceae bacterium]